MVFVINAITDKPVLTVKRNALSFPDRNTALLWMNRQELDTNEFRIICERCFKKRYARKV